ncbi:MAG: dihydrolipoamide dehydrogenase [Chloroflexi bacterium]|nr:MAG: dihydrolipoamide dehydrogenase [Chloroflexota bacterium]
MADAPAPGKRLAVIGAGPGGYPAAFHAALRGLHVTMIDEEENPGGVCTYRGCIPSKALLHAARVIAETHEAKAFGLDFGEPTIDLDALRDWKDSVVRRLTSGLGLIRGQRNVTPVRGRARFADNCSLRVLRDGALDEIGFDHAIVATGSSPVIPGPLQLDSARVMDSTGALELADIPPRLLVIGGGYIGLEMGTVYAALGSKVTVVEMLSGLLSGVDRDLVKPLAAHLNDTFHEILLDTRVSAMEEVEAGIQVTLEAPGGAQSERVFDKVLVAVGRRPNSADLGLESTQVRLDARGFIETDAQLRTAEPTIFAVGDVAGEPMLAHKAMHEARVAVESILGEPAAFEPAAIPAVVFTDPEIAWCGLTEQDASPDHTQIVRYPWRASGRAITLGRPEGLTKLIIEKGSERVLGVGIVGPNAGELIAEGTLAVEMGARASDLQLTIHAHPTLSETVMEAAETFFGTSAHHIARRR